MKEHKLARKALEDRYIFDERKKIAEKNVDFKDKLLVRK